MLVCLAAFVLAFSQPDSTRTTPIKKLVHATWTLKDGVPADIRDLAQTTDGSLWLGTFAGLTRFDGKRFLPFKSQFGDTLPATGVRSLTASGDGGLWIVWRNGQVSRFRDGRLIIYGEHEGLSAANQIAESSTGVVVAGTQTGVVRFANGKWTDMNREWGYDSAAVVALLGKGRIAFVEPRGAYRISTEKWAGYITKYDTRRHQLDQFVIDHLNETTVLLTYRVTLDRNCQSGCEQVPIKLTAMTVWVRRGERWDAAAQSVTPISDGK